MKFYRSYIDYRRGVSLVFVETIKGIFGQVFRIQRRDLPAEFGTVPFSNGGTHAA